MKTSVIRGGLFRSFGKNFKKLGNFSTKYNCYTKYQTTDGIKTAYITNNNQLILRESQRDSDFDYVQTLYYDLNQQGQKILKQKQTLRVDRSSGKFEKLISLVNYNKKGIPESYNCSKHSLNGCTIEIKNKFNEGDNEYGLINKALFYLSQTLFPN